MALHEHHGPQPDSPQVQLLLRLHRRGGRGRGPRTRVGDGGDPRVCLPAELRANQVDAGEIRKFECVISGIIFNLRQSQGRAIRSCTREGGENWRNHAMYRSCNKVGGSPWFRYFSSSCLCSCTYSIYSQGRFACNIFFAKVHGALFFPQSKN